jgi:hypothetical protein
MQTTMKRSAAIIAAVLIAAACSPRIVEKVRTEYVYQDVHHRDTLITRDSVYIREWLRGDTVYIEKYKDRFVYRDRWRDSIRIQRDSFAVERIKEVEIEKPLSWGKRAKIGAFWWLLLAVAGLGAWTFRKPIGGLITKIRRLIF